MDFSKHSEAICVRDAGQEFVIFLDTPSGQIHKKSTLQNLPMDSPTGLFWTLHFACGLSVLQSNRILGETVCEFCSPTDHFETPKCMVAV